MIAWHPFTHEGLIYDLSHLHPQLVTYCQDSKANQPARLYEVQIIYSLHCFTRACKNEEDGKHPLAYADSRETRLFDFNRYERSKQLSSILSSLPISPCYHTNHGNFFTVQMLDPLTGDEDNYEVYFSASRAGTKPVRINLFVQSAYVRDRDHSNQPSRKKINFFVILHNTLNGKPIKPACV